jgi:hypothetical protein
LRATAPDTKISKCPTCSWIVYEIVLFRRTSGFHHAVPCVYQNWQWTGHEFRHVPL